MLNYFYKQYIALILGEGNLNNVTTTSKVNLDSDFDIKFKILFHSVLGKISVGLLACVDFTSKITSKYPFIFDYIDKDYFNNKVESLISHINNFPNNSDIMFNKYKEWADFEVSFSKLIAPLLRFTVALYSVWQVKNGASDGYNTSNIFSYTVKCILFNFYL